MKPALLAISSIVVLLMALPYWLSKSADHAGESSTQVAEVDSFISLTSTDYGEVAKALGDVNKNWHDGSAAILLEATPFTKVRGMRQRVSATLQGKTGQIFGSDSNQWYQWVWNQPYSPHPSYAKFKGELYSTIDSRFREYFDHTETATIRLDEIRWGGVKRDEIPPLKNPEMIPAGDASYLGENDVVFGVEFNGDVRCYPKRILGWHEMFKDTIGGESICGVY